MMWQGNLHCFVPRENLLRNQQQRTYVRSKVFKHTSSGGKHASVGIDVAFQEEPKVVKLSDVARESALFRS